MAAIGAVMDYVDVERIAERWRAPSAAWSTGSSFVRTLDGVRYYNDSIASSPTRAMAGAQLADTPLILIAGGYDKNLDYADFGALVNRRVKNSSWSASPPGRYSTRSWARTITTPTRSTSSCAAILSRRCARRPPARGGGDVVILSPASASFDQFRNFAERGEAFRRIVSGL